MKKMVVAFGVMLALSLPTIADDTSLSDRHIVFIHGLSDSGALWDEMKYILTDDLFVLWDHVVVADYHGSTGKILRGGGGSTPIENVGDIVMSQIMDHYDGNLPNKLDFVVHSMGGLVLRSMVATGRISKERVGRVVTLATPHYGQDCPSLTYQFDQMDYGSVFMWNLANADFIDGNNVLSVVGVGDKVVDYYAAALNGTSVRYVNKSHCGSKLGLWESAPGICGCSGGSLDIVCRMVCQFLSKGVAISGDSSVPQQDTGAFLAQIVDGKGKAVPFSSDAIVRQVVGDRHGSVDFINQSPDRAFEAGVVAPARKADPSLFHVAKSGGGFASDSYKFIVNASKDNTFSEFETSETYDIVNGRTSVVQIPAENTKPVDFVFLIDSTGSMGSSINSVKNNAQRLIQEKLGSGSRNCRVAVADYRDFPVSPYGDSGDYVFKLRCGFTTDASAAISSLSGITANGGADTEEAVYSAIATCIDGYGAALGGWRTNAVKTIMLMCDAGPHDPEPYTGYTRAKIIKMLNTLNSEEDEDDAKVVDEGGGKLYSLKALSLAAASAGESGSVGGISLYPVLTSSSSSLSSSFTSIATETGGKVVNSGNYDSVASAVEKVIEQSIAANGFEFETVAVSESAGSVSVRVYGGNSSMAASVGYQVVAGTAMSGTDYTADGEVHRLSWSEGERSYKTITIPIIKNTASTDDKFFSIILCDGVNMGLGGTSICRIDVQDVSSSGGGIPEGKVFVQGMARQPALGSVSGSGLFEGTGTATLTATPTEGNVFTSWENGSTKAVRTLDIAESMSNAVKGVATYVASFKPLSEIELPTVASEKTLSLCVGEEFCWPFDYSSETEAEVICEGLPLGLLFADNCVTGTPQKTGTYSVDFIVRNAKGDTRTTVTLSVLRTLEAAQGCYDPDDDEPFVDVLTVANTYNGYVLDDEGEFVGTIQVKTAKGVKNKTTGCTSSAVTATLTLEGKKWSYSKGTTGNGDVSGLVCTAKGAPSETLQISLGKNALTGTLGAYKIFGSRNGMVVTGDPMADDLSAYIDNWSMTLQYGTDKYSRWSVIVGAKGVVKVSGVLADGVKVSSTAQLIMGDGFTYIPVSVAKTSKTDAINMLVRIDSDGVVSIAGSDHGYPIATGATESIDLLGLVESDNAMVGVSFRGRVAINELGYPAKFEAKNLPTGLKIDASTGVISGIPTKSGVFDKVVVTVTSGMDAKDKVVETYSISIDALPDWAQGTFTGRLGDGTFNMTITSAGKISGKAATLGTNYTFTVNGYAASSESEYGILTIEAELKSGKAICPIALISSNWETEIGTAIAANGSFSGESEFGDIEAWRILWGTKENLNDMTQWAGTYTYLTADNEILKISIDEKGGVKITGTMNDKRKVSSSTSVIVTDEDKRCVLVSVAPDNKKGLPAFCKLVQIKNWYHEATAGGKIAYRNAAVTADVDSSGTGGGTVTVTPKYGQIESGKSVSLTAKPDKNSVFVKWVYNDPTYGQMAYYGSTLKLESLSGDINAYAVFRLKTDTVSTPYISYNSSDFYNMRVGVVFDSTLTVSDSARPVKFTAKNLPDGLKLDADSGRIYGVPTKEGSRTFSVVATSTVDKKKTSTQNIYASIGELADNLIGTFYGYIDDNSAKTGNPWWGLTRGTFTLTATAQGKLTLKVVSGYGTVSYTATGWAEYDSDTYGGSAAVIFAGKSGEIVSVTVNGNSQWSDTALDGTATGGIFGGVELQLVGQRDAFELTGTSKSKSYVHEELTDFKTSLVGTWKLIAEERSDAGIADGEGRVYPYTHDFYVDQTAKKPDITITVKDTGVVMVSGKFLGEKISGSQKAIVWWWEDGSDCCHVIFHQKLSGGKECSIDFDLRSGQNAEGESIWASGWIKKF